jgi:hypothetical protein
MLVFTFVTVSPAVAAHVPVDLSWTDQAVALWDTQADGPMDGGEGLRNLALFNVGCLTLRAQRLR